MNVGPSTCELVEVEAGRRVLLVERALVLGEQLPQGSLAATASRISAPGMPALERRRAHPNSAGQHVDLDVEGRRRAELLGELGRDDRPQLDDGVAAAALDPPGADDDARLVRDRRSGVSKKKTWRGCASTGSIGRLATVARCWSRTTVIFSSTLSDALMRSISCGDLERRSPAARGSECGRHRGRPLRALPALMRRTARRARP